MQLHLGRHAHRGQPGPQAQATLHGQLQAHKWPQRHPRGLLSALGRRPRGAGGRVFVGSTAAVRDSLGAGVVQQAICHSTRLRLGPQQPRYARKVSASIRGGLTASRVRLILKKRKEVPELTAYPHCRTTGPRRGRSFSVFTTRASPAQEPASWFVALGYHPALPAVRGPGCGHHDFLPSPLSHSPLCTIQSPPIRLIAGASYLSTGPPLQYCHRYKV